MRHIEASCIRYKEENEETKKNTTCILTVYWRIKNEKLFRVVELSPLRFEEELINACSER